MKKRLFIALNLPIAIKAEIFKLIENLTTKNQNQPIKWVTQENIHLTLHFLGDTEENKMEEINSKLENLIANFPPLNFELLAEVDAFPNLKEPQDIFLKINEIGGNHIFSLHKKIGAALLNLGFQIDLRPFQLHLTLGRNKNHAYFQTIKNINFQPNQFQADSVDLMASTLTPQGPIYNIIKKYHLNNNQAR